MHTSCSPNVAPHTPSDVSVLVEEITSLVDKVNSVDSHFLEVKQRILVKILPNDDFAQYHKKYLELVWKSREIAGRAGVACEDFCSDLLDLVSLNTNSSNLKEKKIRDLEIAMGSWRTDGEQESQLSHNFKELSNKLKAFRTAFFDQVAGASASEKIDRLRSEIDRLRADIVCMDDCGKSMYQPLFPGWIHSWSTYKSPHFFGLIEASGQHVTSKEDLRSQMSILEGNLRDIQLVIDKRDDILAEFDAITVDMDSLASEVTSLSAILNLMTSECTELLAVMRSDAPVEDLVRPSVSKHMWRLQGARIVAMRKEFSPIRKSLAAYARA